jgi:4a-hydroxytetrahydrobiopterin dehydratase
MPKNITTPASMKTNKLKQEGKSDGGGPPLKGNALRQFRDQLNKTWRVIGGRKLEKQFKFLDFRQALKFTNRVGQIAEKQGHHPDIFLTYGKVRLQISTHKINGLTESDFILATKVEKLE